MRILLVTGSYPPMKCGVGDYSNNLAKALSVIPGIRVGVLTSFLKEKIEASSIDIFPTVKRWSLAELANVLKTIRRFSPDIVHLQYPTQGYGTGLLPWVLPIFCFLMRKKVVQTWHEGYGRRDAWRLFLKSLVPSMLIFVRPRYSEKVLHPHLRWALWKKKSVFIPNASGIYRACLTDTEKETIKKHYLKKQKRLVVFFGFIYHHKGVELLFEIADPASDQIVIAGEVKDNGYFLRHITNLAYTAPWRDKVTITGFLSTDSLAALLSVADAVILPFRNGAGEWNTSIHAAVLNGAFVITTSLTQRGYDTKHNIYFAKIDDIAEMKSALATYSGTRRDYNAEIDRDEWREIADKHYWLYKEVLS